jgi:peptidoglycan-associated lipoprotein
MARVPAQMISLAVLAAATVILTGCPKRPATVPSAGEPAGSAAAPGRAGSPPPPASAWVGVDVNFATDRAEIRAETQPLLERQAGWLRARPEVRARIEGHADERGRPVYNRALGERRAAAVRDFLVTRGVGADRLTVVSYGEARPLCPEPTPPCLARNRRVRVALVPPGR